MPVNSASSPSASPTEAVRWPQALALDSVYCRLRPIDMDCDGSFDPTRSVTGVSYHGDHDSRDLTVIIPGWHDPDFHTNRLAQREVSAVRAAVSFSLDDNILSSNIGRTITAFENAADTIAEEVRSSHTATRIRWISTSMGTVTLMKTLARHSDLSADEINLTVPGGI